MARKLRSPPPPAASSPTGSSAQTAFPSQRSRAARIADNRDIVTINRELRRDVVSGSHDQPLKEQLLESGGWFGELVVTISKATRVWDMVVLVICMAIAWYFLRTFQKTAAFILGSAFDVTIPAQHYSELHAGIGPMTPVNPSRYRKHKKHLAGYIPVWLALTFAEIMAVPSAPRDYGTRLIGMKTVITTATWMARSGSHFVRSPPMVSGSCSSLSKVKVFRISSSPAPGRGTLVPVRQAGPSAAAQRRHLPCLLNEPFKAYRRPKLRILPILSAWARRK